MEYILVCLNYTSKNSDFWKRKNPIINSYRLLLYFTLKKC